MMTIGISNDNSQNTVNNSVDVESSLFLVAPYVEIEGKSEYEIQDSNRKKRLLSSLFTFQYSHLTINSFFHVHAQ